MPGSDNRIVLSANSSWNLVNFRGGLIRALGDAGYEVVALAPADAAAARLVALGCRHLALPMDNKGTSPGRDLALLYRFWRLLRRERPAAFLCFTIKPNVYGSLAAHALGIPVVNNISGLGTAFIREDWLTRIVKRLYRAALGRSRAVFFQNDDDRMLFVRSGLVRYEQTALLPGSGVDLLRFAPPPADPVGEGRKGISKLRPGAGEEPNGTAEAWAGFCFLLPARMLWDKGIGEFVEAARIVRNAVPGARFQLLGFLESENRTAIDRRTVDAWVAEGIVEYLGAAEDVRPFLIAADCTVLPSYREGTPRSLLEAAAMARPVIATNVPGCREVVEDGVNGFLCRPRDPHDLAQKMLDMIRLPPNSRLAMGLRGRKKVESEFDERIVIARYLDTLDQLRRGKVT